MNDKPIGGYFGWEFPSAKKDFPHSEAALVNSGHHAIQYVLQSLGDVKRVYVPYFTCDVVLLPIKQLTIEYAFYRINENIELVDNIELAEGEYLIYTNYFGIKDAYCKHLAKQYGHNLIVDCAQALFMNPIEGVNAIYSYKKYVGVPDGGAAYITGSCIPEIEVGYSHDLCSSLVERADNDIPKGYASFHKEGELLCQKPLQSMSNLTRSILSSIDFEDIKQRRIANFAYLHSALGKVNKLSRLIDESNSTYECPMVYPFYCGETDLRQRLISNKIFVARYWPNVLEWVAPDDLEYNLTEFIIPLPIDQRYGTEDMDIIIKIIKDGSNG